MNPKGGFSFDGDTAHCREGYQDAEGVLAHLENVGTLLQEALKIAELTLLKFTTPKKNWQNSVSPWLICSPNFLRWSMVFDVR